MATERQIQANRRNAQKSTGPKTEQGKAASSRNSYKHGVLSQGTVADHEEAFDYELLLMGLKEDHNPRSSIEIALVERAANIIWRERRLAETEAAQINKLNHKADEHLAFDFSRHLDLKDQELVGRYQSMIGRQLRDTLNQLREEQERRLNSCDAHPET